MTEVKPEAAVVVGSGLQSFIGKWGNKKPGRKNAASRSAKSENTAAEKEEDAIVLIQKYYRMYRIRKQLTKHIKRTNPAKELLNTETTFVNILGFMVEFFLIPIREGEIIDESSIRSIFSNVESILMLNRTLLDETQERMNCWGFETKLGDVFLKITEFFKVYIDYVKNYENALQTLTDLKKDNAVLRKLLKVQMRKCNGHEYETLESFLITPVQRIPRYNLLLGEILKHTPDSHPDYPDLVAAYEKVQETARYVNDRAREAEQLAKVFSIQNQITGKFERDLISPDRRLIQEGGLVQFYGPKSKLREVYCIVFNDMLVCCKNDSSGSKTGGKFSSIKRGSRVAASNAETQQFEYLARLPFANKKLSIPDEDQPGEYFQFRIEDAITTNSENKALVLGATTKKERSSWATVISKLIQETTEKVVFYDKQKEEVALKKASEARTLIQETYIRQRVHGQGSTDDLTPPNKTGMRKFAQRKQNMSLTPQEKLKFIESAHEQTNEMLREESDQAMEREKEAKAKSEEFKNSTKDRYITKSQDCDAPSNPKYRKFASLKRKQEGLPPQKIPPPVPTRRPFGLDASEAKSPRQEEIPAVESKLKHRSSKTFGSLKKGSWRSKKPKGGSPKSPRSPRGTNTIGGTRDDAGLSPKQSPDALKQAIEDKYSAMGSSEGQPPSEDNQTGLRSWARRRTVGSQNDLN